MVSTWTAPRGRLASAAIAALTALAVVIGGTVAAAPASAHYHEPYPACEEPYFHQDPNYQDPYCDGGGGSTGDGMWYDSHYGVDWDQSSEQAFDMVTNDHGDVVEHQLDSLFIPAVVVAVKAAVKAAAAAGAREFGRRAAAWVAKQIFGSVIFVEQPEYYEWEYIFD